MNASLPVPAYNQISGSRHTAKLMRQVVIYPGEDGFWVAECSSLPGCVSQGATRAEAIINIRKAIAGYFAALQADALPVPEERFETLLVAI